MKTFWKLALLTTLYFSQGLPFGFFSGLPAVLREIGYSLTTISMTSLLALPWALKFLWAPLVDRFGSGPFGARRSWIIPLQLLAVLTMVGMSQTSLDQNLQLVFAGVLFANFLAATQDIATDALAVDLLSFSERGLGNGIQVAAYRIGMIVGGGYLMARLMTIGWQQTYLLMAVLLGVATIPILLYAEPKRRESDQPESVLHAALSFVTRPGIWWWLIPMMFYKAGDAMGTAQLRPMLVDIGVGVKEQAAMVGTVGYVSGLLGALGGGYAASRFGRRPAVLFCGLFQSLAVASYLWPASWTDPTLSNAQWGVLYALCAIEHFAGGTATVALFTLMMDFCKRETAAMDYTFQASLVVIATIFAGTISGPIAQEMGYRLLFLASSIGSFAGVAVIWSLLRRTSIGGDDGIQAASVSVASNDSQSEK